ncbi:hypothetical protein [Devosia sp.]|uniref:hypothetical protein n=1 Tax=Devosia sp. TaxID=1871048 RepID=UPI0032674528
MPTISEEDARNILEPFHERIRAVVDRAWEECRAITEFRASSGFGPRLYRRTLSNEMFDAIASNAVQEFGSDDNVYVRMEAQTLKVFFGGHLLARFKRGAANKLGRNIMTQAVMDFVMPDGMLPGLAPEGSKLEFVWMANDIQTRVEDVLVSARDGNRLIWQYGLGSTAGAQILPFAPRPVPPNDDDTAELVKPKIPADKKHSDEE